MFDKTRIIPFCICLQGFNYSFLLIFSKTLYSVAFKLKDVSELSGWFLFSFLFFYFFFSVKIKGDREYIDMSTYILLIRSEFVFSLKVYQISGSFHRYNTCTLRSRFPRLPNFHFCKSCLPTCQVHNKYKGFYKYTYFSRASFFNLSSKILIRPCHRFLLHRILFHHL